MPTAREMLAEIRGQRLGSVAEQAAASLARKNTNAADVKRRATAAGELAAKRIAEIESGGVKADDELRSKVELQATREVASGRSAADQRSDIRKSAAINTAGGFVEGLAQVATFPLDVSIDVLTAGPARRMLKALRSGQDLRNMPMPQAPMPLTEGVSNVMTEVIGDARSAAGVSPETDTGVSDAVTRLAGNVAAPGPEIAVAGRAAKTRVPQPEVPIAPVAEAAARVDDAARAAEPTTPSTGDLPKYAEPSAVNLNRLETDQTAKRFVADEAERIRPDIEKIKGKRVTHEEVVEAAKDADLLQRATTREETIRRSATLLKTRQAFVSMAETGRVTPDFLKTFEVVSDEASSLGRQLNALAIPAEHGGLSVIDKLKELGKTSDEILDMAKGVDLNDAEQAAQLYRKVVKPRIGEWLDEYRYINLLSSPKTHIVNAFSNILQVGVVRPADKLATGAIDAVAHAFTGRARQYYMSEVPAYAKGIANGFPDAVIGFRDALTGKTRITNLDMQRIPTGTKILRPFQVVPRLLEASDVFFRTLAERGEFNSLVERARKQGDPINEAQIAIDAEAMAKELVFRREPKPSEVDALGKALPSDQGFLLSKVDEATQRVMKLLNTKVGGLQPGRWFVPFVQTPMNILKQGIEHSPLGFATMYGSTKKTEQLAKAAVGSTVFLGAGAMAMQGLTTWAPPRNPKDRAAFYAAGLQPYSVKIGDALVSYSKLGPLAYPIALAAAMRYHSTDAPDARVKSNLALAGGILGGIAEFFSDQSYMQGIGDLLDAARGNESVMAKTISNFATQLVPLSSLQRWVTQIIDPVYRKADRDLSLDAILQNVKRGIPGLSTTVAPYLDDEGNESRRQFPGVNAVSPLNVTQEVPAGMERYRARQELARVRAEAKAARKE